MKNRERKRREYGPRDGTGPGCSKNNDNVDAITELRAEINALRTQISELSRPAVISWFDKHRANEYCKHNNSKVDYEVVDCVHHVYPDLDKIIVLAGKDRIIFAPLETDIYQITEDQVKMLLAFGVDYDEDAGRLIWKMPAT